MSFENFKFREWSDGNDTDPVLKQLELDDRIQKAIISLLRWNKK